MSNEKKYATALVIVLKLLGYALIGVYAGWWVSLGVWCVAAGNKISLLNKME
jgi:hypothetical protein